MEQLTLQELRLQAKETYGDEYEINQEVFSASWNPNDFAPVESRFLLDDRYIESMATIVNAPDPKAVPWSDVWDLWRKIHCSVMWELNQKHVELGFREAQASVHPGRRVFVHLYEMERRVSNLDLAWAIEERRDEVLDWIRALTFIGESKRSEAYCEAVWTLPKTKRGLPNIFFQDELPEESETVFDRNFDVVVEDGLELAQIRFALKHPEWFFTDADDSYDQEGYSCVPEGGTPRRAD